MSADSKNSTQVARPIVAIIVAFILPVILGSQDVRQSAPSGKVALNLSTEKIQYKSGDTIRVRVELKNVGDHPVLVGRELSTIANWPFSIWLRLVDSSGKYAQPVNGIFVDPPRKPDVWGTQIHLHYLRLGHPAGFTLGTQRGGVNGALRAGLL